MCVSGVVNLSAAFDTVDHGKLKQRLEGRTRCRWRSTEVTGFLHGRQEAGGLSERGGV